MWINEHIKGPDDKPLVSQGEDHHLAAITAWLGDLLDSRSK
jgi:hypothetical protein